MSKRNRHPIPSYTHSGRIDPASQRFIEQLVAAQIATREHAERVITRGERSVIEAWTRQLASVNNLEPLEVEALIAAEAWRR